MFKKRVLVYLFGFNFVVLGIALLITSGIGQSAWDGVNVGLSKVFPINVGQATIVSSVTLLTISYLLSKNIHVFFSFVTSLIQGVLVQAYLNIVGKFMYLDNIYYQLILFFVGILLMAVGCAIYIQAKLPTNHVDKLMLSIADRFKLNLRTSKWITDSIAIILTFLLVGKVEWGTFLIIVTLGPMIGFFASKFESPIEKFINEG